jgi:hypothetical protein
MKRKIAPATLILAAVMLMAVAVPALAAVNWTTPLRHTAAFPRATGHAQFQSQPGQRELQIEAEHLKTLAGKRVLFYANGAKLGSAIVTRLGVAQIDRNTERGQTVPKIVHASHVSVRTAGGAVILRGTF